MAGQRAPCIRGTPGGRRRQGRPPRPPHWRSRCWWTGPAASPPSRHQSPSPTCPGRGGQGLGEQMGETGAAGAHGRTGGQLRTARALRKPRYSPQHTGRPPLAVHPYVSCQNSRPLAPPFSWPHAPPRPVGRPTWRAPGRRESSGPSCAAACGRAAPAAPPASAPPAGGAGTPPRSPAAAQRGCPRAACARPLQKGVGAGRGGSSLSPGTQEGAGPLLASPWEGPTGACPLTEPPSITQARTRVRQAPWVLPPAHPPTHPPDTTVA